MRSSRSHPGRFLLVLAALTLVGTGLATEVVLRREETRARGALRGAVARVAVPADAADAARLGEVMTQARRENAQAALCALEAHVLEHATVEGHEALAEAARAAGRFEMAGRHQVFAARLRPRDADARARGERALDLAMLGRLRPVLRIAALVAVACLAVLGLASRARRRRRQRRQAWVRDVRAMLSLHADGQSGPNGAGAHIGPETDSVAVDVFLRPRTPGHQAPTPGPTLSLVLSHAASSTSLRLTPHHDVRGDAVRVRLKDETLDRLLERPGAWRLQARLDDRVLAEARLTVETERANSRLRVLASTRA